MGQRNSTKTSLTIIMLIILLLSGCWDRRELDELGIVLGAGLDKNQENNNIDLVAQLIKPGSSSGSGGQMQGEGGSSDSTWNIKINGETIFQAVRAMTHISSRRLFWVHNNVIIIGEDLAKEGVRSYLDFFLRNEETYPTTWVMVARGKAEDILKVPPSLESSQALSIGDLALAQASTSQTTVVDIIDFSQRLIRPTTSPIAGVLQVVDKDNEKAVRLSGTAVFKNDRLSGFLDEEETRGLLWVIGKIKSGIIVIDRGKEKKISLEIIEANSSLIPEIKDGRISIRVVINVLSDVAELMLEQDLLLEEVIDTIRIEQHQSIKNEIEKAVHKAKSLNADIFGMGDAIYRKYPRLWRQIKSDWDQYFPEIEITLDIRSNLRRSGIINETPAQE